MISAGLTFSARAEAHHAAGLVGPNAVIQLAAAMAKKPDIARAVFARAGLTRLLDSPPDAMIDQSIPARLFDALYAELEPFQATLIAQRAGQLTGNYILAHRIPRFAQYVLRVLPRKLALRLLLKAIAKNAWTFAGTGEVSVQPLAPQIVLAGNPMPMPNATWHVGVFHALFSALVDRDIRITHRHASGRDEFTLHFSD